MQNDSFLEINLYFPVALFRNNQLTYFKSMLAVRFAFDSGYTCPICWNTWLDRIGNVQFFSHF